MENTKHDIVDPYYDILDFLIYTVDSKQINKTHLWIHPLSIQTKYYIRQNKIKLCIWLLLKLFTCQ